MPLYKQNANKIIAAKIQRHQIITGVGISINLPKGPEVLINNVARVRNNKLFK
jgi:hypothetical protein